MKLTQRQFQFVVNSDVETLVAILCEERQMPLLDAFDCVYNSRIYQKLINARTGLYLQSPDYIYGYLQEELPSAHTKQNSKSKSSNREINRTPSLLA